MVSSRAATSRSTFLPRVSLASGLLEDLDPKDAMDAVVLPFVLRGTGGSAGADFCVDFSTVSFSVILRFFLGGSPNCPFTRDLAELPEAFALSACIRFLATSF